MKTKREQKAQIIKSLTEKFQKAKVIAFADYHGLGADKIGQLRQKIKEAGGEFLVAKNTLLARALSINHLPFTQNSLTGPTATIFSYDDEIGPVRAIAEIAKTQGTPKFKFGFFEKDLIDANTLETLAKLPEKSELRTNVVTTIASPIYGIVNVLSANIRNLISVLDQKVKMSSA